MADEPQAREPQYVENETIRELQEIEAKRHKKLNTFEQARLDAIARLALSENDRAENARILQLSSIKHTRLAEFSENPDVKNMQQVYVGRHQKMNTEEQARLDAMARLSEAQLGPSATELHTMSIGRAKNMQVLSVYGRPDDGDSNDNDNLDNNENNIDFGSKAREEQSYNKPIVGRVIPKENDSEKNEKYGFNIPKEDSSDKYLYKNPRMNKNVQIKTNIKKSIDAVDEQYMKKLKNLENRYLKEVDLLRRKIDSHRVVINKKDEEIRDIRRKWREQIHHLEKSKLSLIKSTSYEMEALRSKIRQISKLEKNKLI